MPDAVNPRADRPWTSDRKYAILVDAGSSGSRLQVYSWLDPTVSAAERTRAHKKLKILPKVEKGTPRDDDEWQWKVEPGISSFADHPQDLREYWTPLFDHVHGIIPQDKIAETPVYVMATAGMRLVEETKRNEIIRSTCDFIANHTPFALRGGCQEHVQVITGEQEGLLGWIAINYLMDGFHFRPDDEGDDTASQGKATFGFLDMGGASTQIAFEPSRTALSVADSTAQDQDLTSVTLRLLDGSEVKHDVFVTTFLGFGTNKARERYEERLLSNLATTSRDPCLPSGATTPALDSAHITGNGSFSQCLTALSPLLDKNAPCSHPPCLFHGIHVPPIDFSINHFIGVSEYWFSSDDVFKLGGVYDYVEFQRAAQAFCRRPWSELEASHEWPPQVDVNRLKMQCFKAAWMVTVLHDGIGLPRVIDGKGTGDGKQHVDEVGYKAGQKNLDSPFQSVNEVQGTAVSWTLGKAVLEATQDVPPLAPSQHRFSQMPSPLLALASAGLLLALMVLVLLTRGNSPAAQRRRRAVARWLPCAARKGDGDDDGAGEYMLANMEEGEGDDAEEKEGDDDDDDGDDATDAHAPPSRWTAYLPLPMRRLVLSTSSRVSGTRSSYNKRTRDRPHASLQRVQSTSAMRDSRAASPSLLGMDNTTQMTNLISRPASRNISRPASRASYRSTPLVSPGMQHGNTYFDKAVGGRPAPHSGTWTRTTSCSHTPLAGSVTPSELQQHQPFTLSAISQALDRNQQRSVSANRLGPPVMARYAKGVRVD